MPDFRTIRPELADKSHLHRPSFRVRSLRGLPQNLLADRRVPALIRSEVSSDVSTRAAEVRHRPGQIQSHVDLAVVVGDLVDNLRP